MSKERYNQIIDYIYSLHTADISLSNCVALNPQAIREGWAPDITDEMSKEDFINRIKIDKKFTEQLSKRFAEDLGIEFKIEERELSLEERSFIARSNHYEVSENIKINLGIDEDHTLHKQLDDIGIATKLITIQYNGEKIEVHE
jgi:hypothetical protein